MPNSDKNCVNSEPSHKDCLDLANNLIVWCNLLVPQVNHIAEINSDLIGLLYEKITGSSLSDFISGETKAEEEGIQAIINALSLDVLQLSLSHITGKAVAAGEVIALYNLLHVLEGILLHSTSSGVQAFPVRKFLRTKQRETLKESICEKTPSLLDIEKMFEKNVELKLETELIKNSPSLMSKSERHLCQLSNKPLKKSTYPHYCRKSYLLPRKKHSNQPPFKNIFKEKPQFLQNLEMSRKEGSQTKFIQELLEEFPCIQISPSLMKNIERKYAHHLIRMHKLMKDCLLKRTRAFTKAENVSERQLKLVEILKKDVSQQHYLKKVREEKENERKIKYILRDSRLRSAKLKQYSDEFILNMRKKMTSRNISEELIFKNVFEEIMDIQSEYINYLCEQVKESKIKDDELYLNCLCSLENLYQSQYLALSEEIAKEKSDAQLRLDAERQAIAKAEREFREALKNEIRFMQGVIIEQTKDCHFRKMDAALYIDRKRKEIL